MKKVLILLLILLLALPLAASAETVIRFAHFTAEDHPGHAATVQFCENVTKRTNGEIVFEIYPNNELGDPPTVLEQNILGVIDMSTPTQGSLDKYSKKFAAVMCPFVFDSYEHAWAVLDGPFYDWVDDDLEAQGLKLLGTWEYGFRQTTNSVRPINAVEDLAGLKMRVPPEVQFVAAFEAAGCEVQQIAFSELYLSLQQGVVDGQENPLATIYTNKLYETQPYLAITNHIYSSQVHVMSLSVWERLTEEQQNIILEESANAAVTMRELVVARENDYIAKLEEMGMQVTRPDPASFREAMSAAYDVIRDYAGAENVDAFLAMCEEMR